MKGIVFNTREFAFSDRTKSTRPRGIAPLIRKRQLRSDRYLGCVLIWACIEPGDTDAEAEQASKHIVNLCDQWYGGNRDIVVLPFAHLSERIAAPRVSVRVLRALKDALKVAGCRVRTASFGTHKSYSMDVFGDPRATSFFSFPERSD